MGNCWSPAFFLFQIYPFPNKLLFLCVTSKSHLKTLWEKEESLVNSNFSFFPKCFLPFPRELSTFYIKFKNYHMQFLSVWKSLKFDLWERVREGCIVMNFCHGVFLANAFKLDNSEKFL